MPPLKSFRYKNTLINIIQTVCPKLVVPTRCHGSPPNQQTSQHLGLFLGESLGPDPFPLLQGWYREDETYNSLLPEINTHVIHAVLTSIGNCSFALFSVNFALLDRSKKYLNKQKQP